MSFEWFQSGHPVFEPFQLGLRIQEVETGCVFASESMTLVKQFFLWAAMVGVVSSSVVTNVLASLE